MPVSTPIHRIYGVAGILSLLLSLYAGFSYELVNPDAICYLSSAEAMSQGLLVGMHLCPQAQWPFYSVLIFLTQTLFHVSVTSAAYGLNAVFSLMSVLSFIAIVYCLKPTLRVSLFAALVILMAHEFNALRLDVIRDHGFMAFYLVSIYCFIRYFQGHAWRFAIAWNMSLMIATLFRIEAAVFLLLMPFLVWLESSVKIKSRIRAFLQLHLLTMILLLLLAGLFITHPTLSLTRLHELPYQFFHGWETIVQNFQIRTERLMQYVLTVDSARDAPLVFPLTLISWYFVEVMTVLTPIYFILVGYAWYRGVLTAEKRSRRVLWGYVLVSAGVALAFLAERLFLSKRYLMALCLVLMLWVPFALDDLFIRLKNHRGLWALLLGIILLSAFGGIFRMGYSKAYIRQAGEWLATHVPPQAALYSDDYQVMYYSRHFGNKIFTLIEDYRKLDIEKQWKAFDYLAIRDPKKTIPFTPIKVFSNKRGDRVAIYKKEHKH